MKKRLVSMVLGLTMTMGLMTGCASNTSSETNSTAAAEETEPSSSANTSPSTTTTSDTTSQTSEITLWTFPVGEWGGNYVNEVIAAFNEKNPDISVKVEYLDYASGDDQLTAAIEAGTAPDILLAEPQRLVKYGKNGKLIDVNDMITDELKADIGNESITLACSDGQDYWMYPFTVTAHFMAINYEMWEETGALQYVNQEGDRTWTTDDFMNALRCLKDAGKISGIVYCGGQGGDQGTRALVSNLYSSDFTNADHTEWNINSNEGIKGLQLLKDLCDEGALTYDAGMAAADELQMFANGTVAMSFCWNAANAKNYAESAAFTPYALPFPSDDKTPVLESGLYGFGIFNNGDETKVNSAKTLISFMCDDAEWGPKSVEAAGFFPTRKSFECYQGNPDTEMPFYNTMLDYVGDNFTTMEGFVEQRKEWWTMLQYIFSGEKTIEQAANDYVTICNEYTQAATK